MEITIKPQKGININLKELWEYRELFYFFTWRNIKVKYKQAFLGCLWAILRPFITMVIFAFLFGKVLDISTDGIPKPIFYFSGLLIWNIFSLGVTESGNSMVTNSNIIKKIYFPRLIIPMSSILSAVFDFLMAFTVFIGLIIYYEMDVNVLKMLFLLGFSLLLTIISTFGIGCIFAALNVKYRDFRYIVPFFVQSLMFLSPVIYPVSVFNNYPWAKYVLAINPMTSAVNLSRNSVIDAPIDYNALIISTATGIILFITGILYFRKSESYFADIV